MYILFTIHLQICAVVHSMQLIGAYIVCVCVLLSLFLTSSHILLFSTIHTLSKRIRILHVIKRFFLQK